MEGRPLLLLGVTGSIAAYKAPEILRQLIARGDLTVTVALTPAATRFVGALTFSALSGAPVYDDHLAWAVEGGTDTGIRHTDISSRAAALVIAPATADCLARLAGGRADDPVSVLALALPAGAPLVIAPAMNPRMWAHPAVQENVAVLRRRGAVFIGPDEGTMACGDTGTGRMSSPEEIVAGTRRALASARRTTPPRRVLILSGPTREAIDDVRFLSNGSSGRMGAALAAASWERGDDVHVISGPAAVLPSPWIPTTRVESASEMLEAARSVSCDLLISPAAVADWRPEARLTGKPAKADARNLPLVPTPDVLASLMRDAAFTATRPVAVAFAAESGTGSDAVERALAKARAKGARWIVLNDANAVMGAEDATVILLGGDERVETRIGPHAKEELARRLLTSVHAALDSGLG